MTAVHLDEIFESELTLRKTVWSKRGDTVTRRDVERVLVSDVQPRSRIITTEPESQHADA